MGIEPTSEAWEASILPLYDARVPNYRNKTLPTLQEPVRGSHFSRSFHI